MSSAEQYRLLSQLKKKEKRKLTSRLHCITLSSITTAFTGRTAPLQWQSVTKIFWLLYISIFDLYRKENNFSVIRYNYFLSYLFIDYSGDQIKKNEMGWECGT
jgi:hypothetical protein